MALPYLGDFFAARTQKASPARTAFLGSSASLVLSADLNLKFLRFPAA